MVDSRRMIDVQTADSRHDDSHASSTSLISSPSIVLHHSVTVVLSTMRLTVAVKNSSSLVSMYWLRLKLFFYLHCILTNRLPSLFVLTYYAFIYFCLKRKANETKL